MQNMLLVIDDVPEICNIFQRSLKQSFPVIHVATCAAEASPLLTSEPITHIICDLFLGKNEPLGCELMEEWKKRKPNIRYVAILTGSNIDPQQSYDGVDAVFHKPDGIMQIIEFLKKQAL